MFQERGEKFALMRQMQELRVALQAAADGGASASPHLMRLVIDQLKSMGAIECFCCMEDVCHALPVPSSRKFNEASLIICRECAAAVCGACASELKKEGRRFACGLCNTPLDSQLEFVTDPKAAALFALGQAFRNCLDDTERTNAIRKLRDLGSPYDTCDFTSFIALDGIPDAINTPAGFGLWQQCVGAENDSTADSDRPKNSTLFELAMERRKRQAEASSEELRAKRAKVAADRALDAVRDAVSDDVADPATQHEKNLDLICRPTKYEKSKCGNSGKNPVLDQPMKRNPQLKAHYLKKGEGIANVDGTWMCRACISIEDAARLAAMKK